MEITNYRNRKTCKKERGISVVEILIVIFVAVVLLFSIAGVAAMSFRLAAEKKLELRAAYYAREGLEALKALRDESWDARIAPLAANTTYYFVPTANAWTLSASNPGALDRIFTRTAVMQNVSRDEGTSDIVSSGGANDPDTKKFTVSVLWQTQSGQKNFSVDAYVANLLRN